jgi:hypothetical protein
MRDFRVIGVLVAAGLAAAALACNGPCGLGLHERASWSGGVAPGEVSFRDFPLKPQRGDMEIDLSSTAASPQPGSVDAYLTDTSCAKLFDQPYPGTPPLCRILAGPAAYGKVSPRVPLPAGSYRLWAVGYSGNQSEQKILIDIDIWDYDCRRSPLQ